MRKERVILKHRVHAALFRRHGGDIASVQQHLAPVRQEKPAMIRSVAVFPQPLRPSRGKKNSPRWICNDTSRSTCVSPNDFPRFRIASSSSFTSVPFPHRRKNPPPVVSLPLFVLYTRAPFQDTKRPRKHRDPSAVALFRFRGRHSVWRMVPRGPFSPIGHAAASPAIPLPVPAWPRPAGLGFAGWPWPRRCRFPCTGAGSRPDTRPQAPPRRRRLPRRL